MARASKFLRPKFLQQSDLAQYPDSELVTSIKGFRVTRIAGEERLALFFEGLEKGLPLNQTNLESVITMHGGDDDTAHWIGTAVRIYIDPDVVFQDEQVGGIRVGPVAKEEKRSLFGGRS